ncbi:hypothetical protein DPM19_01200 [Actinomadura craniellae]|uniref:Uncharacterized protein n=1 Tax=Actinomadura craniellae TaxID=2231787 RepID=A0A365HF74_9ACTN|nr:hypothetical protein [Actinomadura craniellae]RAY16813.1 hypothetical protein DPM19_01200 [Actinomadura craniellae]
MNDVRWTGGVSPIPAGEGWLVHTPAEEFLAIEPDGGTTDLTDPELRSALAAEGVLAGPAPRPGTVGVAGDCPLADAVADLLTRTGIRALRGTEDELIGRAAGLAALVACAPWLPDRRWTELDARCLAAGLPWHRGHAEGRRWYTGPFRTGPADAGYTDTRTRRLAASPWPDELTAYWRWLDEGGRPEPDPAAPIGAAMAAALITADLRAWLCGEDPPGRGVQAGADPATGRVARHPVLPIPAGLMREAPAPARAGR